MCSGDISRITVGEGARSTAGLPWQPMQRVWKTANPDSGPADPCGARAGGACAGKVPNEHRNANAVKQEILFISSLCYRIGNLMSQRLATPQFPCPAVVVRDRLLALFRRQISNVLAKRHCLGLHLRVHIEIN